MWIKMCSMCFLLVVFGAGAGAENQQKKENRNENDLQNGTLFNNIQSGYNA